MALTFYYAPMSTASVTELVLEELGVAVTKVKLDLKKGDTKTSEFRKLNPNAMIPVLVHDGTVLWESAALTLYLGETFGVERKLYPAPGPRRGEAMKWIAWSSATLVERFGRFARNTMAWVPVDERNAKAGARAMDQVKESLRVLDGALDSKPYLLGEYSLADTHVNSFIDWLRHTKVDFSDYPSLNAWSTRANDRPSVKKLAAAR